MGKLIVVLAALFVVSGCETIDGAHFSVSTYHPGYGHYYPYYRQPVYIIEHNHYVRPRIYSPPVIVQPKRRQGERRRHNVRNRRP